jgi:hypothetical protein
MKWFWLLRFRKTKKNALVTDIIDIDDDMRDRLYMCTAIPDWPAEATVRVGPSGRDGPADNFLQNGVGIDILSSELTEAVSATVVD